MAKTRMKQIRELQEVVLSFTKSITEFNEKIGEVKDKKFKLKLLDILILFNKIQIQFINLLGDRMPESFKKDMVDLNFYHIIKPLKKELEENNE